MSKELTPLESLTNKKAGFPASGIILRLSNYYLINFYIKTKEEFDLLKEILK